MNSPNNYNTLRFKLCAGRDCEKKGIHPLQIQYIKKIGYFCDSCTAELLELGIATKEEIQK